MFSFFKSNKNTKMSKSLAELDKKIFPNRKEQKEVGARELMRLSNGKLDFMQSLKIYATAKARFYISADIGSDQMTKHIIKDSNNTLTYIEATNILKFVMFEKEEPSERDNIAFNKVFNAGFNPNNVGYNLDMIPNSYGEFGLKVTNPIPVKGIISNEKYLKKLRTESGEKINWKREGSTKAGNILNPIDIYQIFNQNGEFLTKLYISPYHKRTSNIAPNGFIIYDPDKTTLKKFLPNFVEYFMSRKESLELKVNIDTGSVIEFSMPIITFGNVYGYNFYGIKDDFDKLILYLNVESKKGYLIEGPKVQISEDLTFEEYEKEINKIIQDVILNTEYLKITEGIL